MVIVLAHAKGLYRPRLRPSVLDDLPRLLQTSIPAAIGVAIAVHLWRLSPGTRTFVALAVIATGGQIAMRAMMYAALRAAYKRGWLLHNCLVAGGGRVAGDIVRAVAADTRYGLNLVGFVDDKPLAGAIDPRRWLGTSRDL
jgi:FlaA1/EpsC-like NDP-sugar epimerase